MHVYWSVYWSALLGAIRPALQMLTRLLRWVVGWSGWLGFQSPSEGGGVVKHKKIATRTTTSNTESTTGPANMPCASKMCTYILIQLLLLLVPVSCGCPTPFRLFFFASPLLWRSTDSLADALCLRRTICAADHGLRLFRGICGTVEWSWWKFFFFNNFFFPFYYKELFHDF